ncbi:MAG: Lipoprotein-releasing system ATP-binding protein LolD [Myxococcota bacterium]|nr:Lipoprotein-releasing system ATP-binding protein LolD [Myxococcota bacterium]
MAFIELKGLTREYQDGAFARRVLDAVDLSIAAGEFAAITGRSGSGKSTLLNIIGGLDTHYTGEITVDGVNLRAMGDGKLSRFRNHTCGYIFQGFNLLEHLTCLQNVLAPAAFSGERGGMEARAREVLRRVGLEDRMNQRPRTLSGGERQRTAIARALLMKPRILLCDEPTGNLDYGTADQILELFQDLNRNEDITFLIVTHEDRVAKLGKRVLRLREGKLMEEAPPQ